MNKKDRNFTYLQKNHCKTSWNLDHDVNEAVKDLTVNEVVKIAEVGVKLNQEEVRVNPDSLTVLGSAI